MKKITLPIVLLFTMLCFSLVACGDDDDNNGENGSGGTAPTGVKLSLYSDGLYTDGTLIYRILDENKHKAQLVGTRDIDITTLNVPEVVLIEAQRYTVTRIGRMYHDSGYYEDNDPYLFNDDEGARIWDEKEEETPQEIFYFHRCSKLIHINIPASVTSIRNYTFEDTPWYVAQPDGLVYVGKVAYRYKGEMTEGNSVTIKEGTLGVADYAFRSCEDMVGVAIPASLVTIGYNAFYNCNGLEIVYISDLSAWCNIDAQTDLGFGWDDTNPMYLCGHLYLNGKEVEGDITLPATVTSIATGAFYGSEQLNSVTLPSSVRRIGHWAFMHCSNLSEINLSNQLERIEHDAFKHCYGLTEIVFPASLRYVGLSAYEDCTGLNSVTIPDAPIFFGERAFAYCYNLCDVIVLSKTPYTYSWDEGEGNDIFRGCSSGATLHVPAGCADIYRDTWPWSNFGYIVEDAK